MHDYCIRMTALLKCFELTLNKPHNRAGSITLTMLSINSKQLGVTFGALSFYFDLIFKEYVPSHSIIIGTEGGVVIVLLVIVTFKINE